MDRNRRGDRPAAAAAAPAPPAERSSSLSVVPPNAYQFYGAMPLMLEIATVLAAIVGSYTNVVIIALMLLINALIGAAIL